MNSFATRSGFVLVLVAVGFGGLNYVASADAARDICRSHLADQGFGLTGEAPDICLSQPIGLGYVSIPKLEGQRPGHLSAEESGSAGPGSTGASTQTAGPLVLQASNVTLPSPVGWARQLAGPLVRNRYTLNRVKLENRDSTERSLSQLPDARPPADTRASHAVHTGARSLSRDRLEWPSWDDVSRTLLLRDYNTRIVAIGTTTLGVAAGIVGVFMLLRGRSLLGDVVSHSTLPGIAIAFLVMEMIAPGGGKWLPGLLIGAWLAGLAGIVCTKLILRYTRIKEDAALAIVLSVFFGAGMSLLKAVQDIPSGSQAGLNHFILGKTASMVAADVWINAEVSLAIVVLVWLLFKEFALLSFDDKFAASQGWPIFRLDLLLMLLVAGVTVIGLQSVGLLLVVAMLITPAAAARFWTDRLGRTTLVAGLLGGGGALGGVLISAMYPRLAAGPVIVLTGAAVFLVSMFFGVRRGVIVRVVTHRKLKAAVGRQHILRALFEYLEPHCDLAAPMTAQLVNHIVSASDLQPMRSWTPKRLRYLLHMAESAEFIAAVRDGGYRLTTRGAELAHRVVRNHRLWELYLIEYADIAPSHVDRDADDIEHLLDPEIIESLELLLSRRYPHMTVPPSPHAIDTASGLTTQQRAL